MNPKTELLLSEAVAARSAAIRAFELSADATREADAAELAATEARQKARDAAAVAASTAERALSLMSTLKEQGTTIDTPANFGAKHALVSHALVITGGALGRQPPAIAPLEG